MLGRWPRRLRLFSRHLWVRVSIFSGLAVVASLASIYLAPLVPDGFSDLLGTDAVDSILTILASSMLTVTTFSLTVMVAAHSAATANTTPRALTLLIEDSTTQNALATFLGSFLFSLVGIIALSTDLYGEKGRVILFWATVLVVVYIVITFVSWIDHLSTLGRIEETIGRVEKAATRAFADRIENQNLGGARLLQSSEPPRGTAVPLRSEVVGYVQHIDIPGISERAGEEHLVYLAVLPGQFVGPSEILAWFDRGVDERDVERARQMFTIKDERSFDQDPRFGLIALSEIASKALSPGVNDPGTAIDIIGRAVRVLSLWIRGKGSADSKVLYPNVLVPSLKLDDLFDDLFTPISRDGAANSEVQTRLIKALGMLAALDDPEASKAARHHARMVVRRAEANMMISEDVQAIRSEAESAFPGIGLDEDEPPISSDLAPQSSPKRKKPSDG